MLFLFKHEVFFLVERDFISFGSEFFEADSLRKA